VKREAALPDGSALCVGCGMCCDGTLFDRIGVTAEEQVRLKVLGFSLLRYEGEMVFEQPCRSDDCGSCLIYEARPVVCRRFRCGLLQAYQSGAISLDAAKSKQDKARELIAAVAADDPAAVRNGPRHKLRLQLAEQMQAGGPETRRVLARRFLNVIALDSYLERWFRAKEKPFSAAQTPG